MSDSTRKAPDAAKEVRLQAASLYDQIAATYDESYADERSKAEDRFTASLIRRYLEPHHLGRGIVDVGCGTGWMLDNDLVPDGVPYVGFDISPGMVQRARMKHPERARNLKVHDMLNGEWPVPERPWPQSRAGAVVSTLCAPSYASPHDFMARAAKALAVGGLAIVMPHAEGNARRRQHIDPEVLDYEHPWSSEEAVRAAERAGLQVRVLTGVSHPTWGPRNGGWPRAAHDLWMRAVEPAAYRVLDVDDHATFLFIVAERR